MESMSEFIKKKKKLGHSAKYWKCLMKNGSFIFTFIVYLIGLSLSPKAAALIFFLSYKNVSTSFTHVF